MSNALHHMQLLFSRTVSFIDASSLAICEAREALFRNGSKDFILYLSNGDGSSASEERLLFLELREALIWLNEAPEEQGSFWM
ncbi:hypothetical protein [Bradyrhizobium guangdongense]|uniref:Uncharacterized protein n=2 Tax=Bradyrhizobium guangdongense TaxID=1325090 RepID=A0AA87WBE5_9BRAD|nr:hypothetical protein [Bradyrhizobium guangdongense]GGI33299.1 hypothetical protein GCM10010987_73690 [Bradyrhizobium guangdongense]